MTALRTAFPACAALALAAAVALPPAAAQAEPVRIAFGDIEAVESLHFLIALERAKEAGLEIELTSFKSEDIAAQAVVGGQADIGVGTPYALLQKVQVPIRLFYQMSTLRFYPVVNAEKYQDWADLDGQPVAVHSRGSGTEAIMQLMADKHGITYSEVSYVPGSEVRAGALLQGNIDATILDSTNRDIVMERAPGKFVLLPMEGVNATDEALYATADYLAENPAVIDTLVEALLTTWREVNADPAGIAALRDQYGLLAEVPEELTADIVPYFTEAAASKALPLNGGSEEAVKDDFAFYALAGQLEGDPATLVVADFWDFAPLNRALDKLGRQ